MSIADTKFFFVVTMKKSEKTTNKETTEHELNL